MFSKGFEHCRGSHAGEVGEYAGDVGEYAGDVGEYLKKSQAN